MMTLNQSKILLISHDLSLTGAVKILLKICQKLKSENFTLQIWTSKYGSLEKDFTTIATTRYIAVEPPEYRQYHSVSDFYVSQAKGIVSFVKPFYWFNLNLVLINTTLCQRLLIAAKELGKSVVLHIHEIENYVKSPENILMKANLELADSKIAVSQASINWFNQQFNIDTSDWVRIPAFIDAEQIEFKIASYNLIQIESELGILPDTFFLLGSGVVSQEKGLDLWIETCLKVINYFPNKDIKCIWMGKVLPDFEPFYKDQIDKIPDNIKKKIIFLGELENPYPYIKRANILFLSSRAEAFSISLIEAMYLRVPVLSFACGGPNEILSLEAKNLIKEFDSEKAADYIINGIKSGYFPQSNENPREYVCENYLSKSAIDKVVDQIKERLSSGQRIKSSSFITEYLKLRIKALADCIETSYVGKEFVELNHSDNTSVEELLKIEQVLISYLDAQTRIKLKQTQSQLQKTNDGLEIFKFHIKATQEALAQTNSQLHQTQVELADTQLQLGQAQVTIAGMESSKFWKLRTAWLKFKQKIGIPTDE